MVLDFTSFVNKALFIKSVSLEDRPVTSGTDVRNFVVSTDIASNKYVSDSIIHSPNEACSVKGESNNVGPEGLSVTAPGVSSGNSMNSVLTSSHPSFHFAQPISREHFRLYHTDDAGRSEGKLLWDAQFDLSSGPGGVGQDIPSNLRFVEAGSSHPNFDKFLDPLNNYGKYTLQLSGDVNETLHLQSGMFKVVQEIAAQSSSSSSSGSSHQVQITPVADEFGQGGGRADFSAPVSRGDMSQGNGSNPLMNSSFDQWGVQQLMYLLRTSNNLEMKNEMKCFF